MFVTDQTDNKDSAEITIQVPRYIPSNIVKMASSTTEDLMAVLSSGNRNKLFMYKWYYSGDEKLQSAWGEWDFPDGYSILSAEFLEENLYIVYKSNSGVHIDKIVVEDGEGIDATPNDILLDRKVTNSDCTISYDAGTEVTTITVPYTESATWQVVQSDGTVPAINSQTSTQILNPGDLSATTFHVGLPYTFEYEYSHQYVRSGERGSETPIQDGRLQLRYFSLLYINTAQFTVEVTPTNRSLRSYTFSGRVLGSEANVLDSVSYDTGEFRFPIFSKNDEVKIVIKNDSPFNSAFSSTDWEGMYQPKSSRI